MAQGLRVKKNTSKSGYYTSSDVDVRLPNHDTDVNLRLPNGRSLVIQFRVEGPSLDFLLPGKQHVHNWRGTEMKPARVPKGQEPHVHLADQLMIPLDANFLDIVDGD
jgi:hypothetical protein